MKRARSSGGPELTTPASQVRLEPYTPTWAARFKTEAARLRGALEDATAGGVLFDLEHIGSTAVPGLAAKSCIDIMARVHPLPLPREKVEALTRLGYEHLGEHGLLGRHYFRKGLHDVHLHVVSFDTEHWARHLVFRDFLRAHPEAAARYEGLKLELAARFAHDRNAYSEGKGPLIQELEREAFSWHVLTTGFTPVEAVARELRGFVRPWFVASGWALDLFLGAPSRYHDDLDLGIFRDDAPALQAHLLARGWRLHQVVEDGTYALWAAGEGLETKVTQVHARRNGDFLDILLTPRQRNLWLYRRDEEISLPLERALLTQGCLVHLVPEAVLLFKSRTSGKLPRGKDQEDFVRVLPRLSAAQCGWLRTALLRDHPGHPWLARL